MDKKVVFIHNNICKETGQEVVLEELFVLKQLRCNAFGIFLLGRYNMSEY